MPIESLKKSAVQGGPAEVGAIVSVQGPLPAGLPAEAAGQLAQMDPSSLSALLADPVSMHQVNPTCNSQCLKWQLLTYGYGS